jgi:Rps23 Pro-64 3,4-dihydroxylase Tpa1-like proline 4-hydroxylase
MNLTYHIPDKLYYINNFLDYQTYKKLHYDVFKSKLVTLESIKGKWDEKLVYGHNKFTNRAILNDQNVLLNKLKILIKANPFHKIKNNNFVHMIHSMNDNAGINWHTDHGHQYGITYYINRRWNSKFGGELLFRHEKQTGFIPIVGNSLVIIKAPLDHKVVNVTKPLVPRKTIQIFINEKKDNV